LGVANVVQRIRIEQNQVGQFAFLNRAQLIFHPQELRRIQGCRL